MDSAMDFPGAHSSRWRQCHPTIDAMHPGNTKMAQIIGKVALRPTASSLATVQTKHVVSP